MGLNAYLTVIAQSEYRKYPRVNPTPLAEFNLHKEWPPLEQALRTMPPPLDLALRGNQPTLDDFEDDWDAYDAFVTPGMVRTIHKALENVSDDVLSDALKGLGYSTRRERTSYLAAFEELKAAYREAAKRDAYIRIFIC